MLHIAVWYRQKTDWNQNSDFVLYGYLVVFLIMHITTIPRSTSPTRGLHIYECIWPSADGGNNDSPPTSPVPPHRKHLGGPNSTAPLSPRSPRSAGGGGGSGSTSPRKQLSPRLNTATSFVRTHAQHLSVLREKIPLLLFALSLQDSIKAEHKEDSVENENESSFPHSHKRSAQQLNENNDGAGSRREDSPLFSATIAPFSLDSLGLLVGAGITKRREVVSLSFIYQTDSSSEEQSSALENKSPTRFRCAHLADSMDAKLELNDLLYPPSPAFGSLSPSSSGNSGSVSPHSPGADISMVHRVNTSTEFPAPNHASPPSPTSHDTVTNPPIQTGQPIRRVISSDSPQSREPTVVHGSGCTTFRILNVHGNRISNAADEHCSETKSLGHLDDDENELLILEDNEDMTGTTACANDSGRVVQNEVKGDGLLVPERYGPVLVSGCSRAHLFLLSPYAFASVSSCSDSEIVLGAVAGVVVMSGCERVQLTVACRKLILWNCRDCDIRVATLTPSIVSGDSRGLTFGK